MEVIQWTDASPGAKSNDANADASLNDFLAQKNWLNQVFLRIFYVDVISVWGYISPLSYFWKVTLHFSQTQV